ncbi:tetratricopeptide repeat protein [Sphingomonas quercus]|uniref:Tetratricopeptide repeat protein n=1 Tax=Sphingomonas quercus TaxID=2842451 RepID=A0ABS6BMI6_9SPHN|nr:hypothetical protein [Sphingomonas quercus]MBU3079399.1 hypothetical protein [Sphingomonas quercus]
MRKISSMTLGAALALGVAGVVAVAPADAQRNKKEKEEQPAQPQFKLSKGVRENVGAAQEAAGKNDFATAEAKLTAADPLAQTNDDKYVIGITKLNIAAKQNDNAKIAAAIDQVIGSGSAPAADLPTLYKNQGALAAQAKDMAKAEAAYAKLNEIDPNKPDNLVALAEIKYQNKKPQEALDALDKAVAAQKASGQPVNENWYKRGLGIAYDSKLKPETLKWSEEYVKAYPTPTSWRTALQIYRQDNPLDDNATLDLYRLARAAKALNGERDFFEYASAALDRGLPGEAEAVIDEGFNSKMVDASSKPLGEVKALASPKIAADKASLPASATRAASAADGRPAMNTADAYLGYGDYAKAAELYKLALTKGGVDASTANTRLGIALARSGQKEAAIAAFAQVTGARKPIAEYWTIWISQQA